MIITTILHQLAEEGHDIQDAALQTVSEGRAPSGHLGVWQRKAGNWAISTQDTQAGWGHFNLHGEFDLSDEKLEDSVGLRVPKKLDLTTA